MDAAAGSESRPPVGRVHQIFQKSLALGSRVRCARLGRGRVRVGVEKAAAVLHARPCSRSEQVMVGQMDAVNVDLQLFPCA